jgi:hypothetical protein
MAEGLLEEIRRACREVTRRARHVEIDGELLRAYARSLPPQVQSLPQLDPRCHLLGRGPDTAAFMLSLEAVNFGSGWFPELRPYDGMRGYFAVAGALRDRFAEGVPTASEMASWTWEDCARIFGQDPEHEPARELMTLFAQALNELGSHILASYQGRFEALLEAAGGSAERLVELLVELPGFADIARYGDLRVPLLKRAPIAAADTSLAFEGQGLGHFHDLDRLTTFADDLVPHVLRTDGVLRYSEELAGRIARGEFLPSGSEEEVEIRASTIDAVERIAAELRAAGRPTTAMQVDYLLWNRGLEGRYKVVPRHRTRSRFY